VDVAVVWPPPPDNSPLMKTISVRIDGAADYRLTALARRTGQTRSSLVRAALEAFLKREDCWEAYSCLELAADLAGCVAGPGDLSVNNDHLRGYGR
jgi:predicted transcriptional regulator